MPEKTVIPESEAQAMADQRVNAKRPKTAFKLSTIGSDTLISYPSTGPILDESGGIIHNGHSILHEVNGEQVWLHADHATHSGNEVTMPLWHAKDMNLPTPD